jgi:polar amino acid transport system substrate-binding protein
MKYQSGLRGLLRCSLTFFVISLISSGNSFARDELPLIEYAYPDQSVWTTKVDVQGNPDNPLLHFADALFGKLQLRWRATPYPAHRMYRRLELGKSNFSILVRAPRLSKYCIFSKNPVVFTELRVYRKSSSPAVTSKEDLAGKSVILIRGYSYGGIGKYLRASANHVVVNETSQHESAFAMLRYHRAEYLLDYAGPSEEILTGHPHPNVTYDVLTRLDVFLVLSKTYPNSKAVMAEMERVASSIDVRRWGFLKP